MLGMAVVYPTPGPASAGVAFLDYQNRSMPSTIGVDGMMKQRRTYALVRHVARSSSLAALVALALVSPASGLNAAQPVVVSQTPVKGTPNVLDGTVFAVVPVGGEIVVGGSFTKVKSANGITYARSGIFAYDPATGQVDPSFAPVLTGGEVDALVASADGKSVFAGGKFLTVNGTTTKRLTKLTLATGKADPTFKPTVVGTWVETMAMKGRWLYVGGAFSSVDGVTRGRFAAVDTTTGALNKNVNVNFDVKRQGTLRVAHMAINPAGTRLVATGTFTQTNGITNNQIAMLDLTTTPVSVMNWQTSRFKAACAKDFDTYVRGVDFSPDGSYFVVVTTGAWEGGPAAGSICDSASRWETNASGKGVQPTWVDYSGGDSFTAVAVTGTAIYVGGHQRWMNNPYAGDSQGPGGVPRSGIAALDPVNGMPLAWNPGRNPRGTGAWALTATADGLWVGSDTAYIDGLYRARLAFLPVTGGSAPTQPQPGTLPGTLVTLGGADPVERSFDGAALGSPSAVTGSGIDWAGVRGAFMLGSHLYCGWDTGQLTEQDFDGGTFGPPVQVDLNGLTSAEFDISNLSGMFFDSATGRLYYTISGDTHLYYRYFEPDSNAVGTQTFVASGATDGLDWSHVSGMTMAGGQIYFRANDPGSGVTDYSLYRIAFTGGKPVAGTQALVSADGPDAAPGMFLLSH
jgi:hypothetical protein